MPRKFPGPPFASSIQAASHRRSTLTHLTWIRNKQDLDVMFACRSACLLGLDAKFLRSIMAAFCPEEVMPALSTLLTCVHTYVLDYTGLFETHAEACCLLPVVSCYACSASLTLKSVVYDCNYCTRKQSMYVILMSTFYTYSPEL